MGTTNGVWLFLFLVAIRVLRRKKNRKKKKEKTITILLLARASAFNMYRTPSCGFGGLLIRFVCGNVRNGTGQGKRDP